MCLSEVKDMSALYPLSVSCMCKSWSSLQIPENCVLRRSSGGKQAQLQSGHSRLGCTVYSLTSVKKKVKVMRYLQMSTFLLIGIVSKMTFVVSLCVFVAAWLNIVIKRKKNKQPSM